MKLSTIKTFVKTITDTTPVETKTASENFLLAPYAQFSVATSAVLMTTATVAGAVMNKAISKRIKNPLIKSAFDGLTKIGMVSSQVAFGVTVVGLYDKRKKVMAAKNESIVH